MDSNATTTTQPPTAEVVTTWEPISDDTGQRQALLAILFGPRPAGAR